MVDVFISYSRKDKEFVRRLSDALIANERKLWVDWEDIPLSADWWAEIQTGIEAADNCIFILTPDYVSSDVCGQELAHAQQHNKRLVPILYREVSPKDVPPALSQLNWIYMRPPDDFEGATKALLQTLDTDLDWVKMHTRLLVRALEWQQHKQNDSYLLRGADLDQAERRLAQTNKSPELTPLHGEYILMSRRSAEKRQRRILAAITLALIVSIVLAIVAFTQYLRAETERKQAMAKELVAYAQSNLRIDPELSILLGLQALSVANIIEADAALQQAVQTSLAEATLVGHQDAVAGVAFSPDNRRLATASYDHTLKIWQVESRQVVLTLSGHTDSVNDVAFNPDGLRLATASADRTARVWSLDQPAGQTLLTLTGHTGPVNQVIFNPDGSRLATASEDGTVRLWDAVTGQEVARFTSIDALNSLVFSPDGRRLAAAGQSRFIKIWDIATGQEVITFFGHTNTILSLAISPDGRQLASASADRTVRIYFLHHDQLMALLPSRLTR